VVQPKKDWVAARNTNAPLHPSAGRPFPERLLGVVKFQQFAINSFCGLTVTFKLLFYELLFCNIVVRWTIALGRRF
jgi:hypothetical protein